MLERLQELRSGDVRGVFARTGATRSWRSRWPCPKPCTTLLLEVHGTCRTQPYGDRRRTGQERGRPASRTSPFGDRSGLPRGSGRRLCLRWPSRKQQRQPGRTGLLGCRRLRPPCWAAATAWTLPPSPSSSSKASCGRRRRQRREGRKRSGSGGSRRTRRWTNCMWSSLPW